MMRSRTHRPNPLELSVKEVVIPRVPLEKTDNLEQSTRTTARKTKKRSAQEKREEKEVKEAQQTQRQRRENVKEKMQGKICKGLMAKEQEVVDVDEVTTLTVRQELVSSPYQLNDIKQIISWRVQRDEWRLTNPNSTRPHYPKHPNPSHPLSSNNTPIITWLLTPSPVCKETRGGPRRATRSNNESSCDLNEGDILSWSLRVQMLKFSRCLKMLDELKNCRVPTSNLAKVLCLPEYRRYSVQHVFFVHRLRKQLSQREIVTIS